MKQAFFIINTLTSNPQLDINTIKLKLPLDLRIKNNTNSFAVISNGITTIYFLKNIFFNENKKAI